MSNLTPSFITPTDLVRPRERSLSRHTSRAIQRNEERALVATSELLATEYVASVAMDAVARTARDEVYYSSQLPGFEHRFRAIGEAQALSAALKVRDMGR